MLWSFVWGRSRKPSHHVSKGVFHSLGNWTWKSGNTAWYSIYKWLDYCMLGLLCSKLIIKPLKSLWQSVTRRSTCCKSCDICNRKIYFQEGIRTCYMLTLAMVWNMTIFNGRVNLFRYIWFISCCVSLILFQEVSQIPVSYSGTWALLLKFSCREKEYLWSVKLGSTTTKIFIKMCI